MPDTGRGSYANQIDPEGGIKGPKISGEFERANDNRTGPEASQGRASEQVANTNLSPRQPSPSFGYDRAKAAQHIASMRADDQAVRTPALAAKARLLMDQKAERKAKGAPSLGKSFSRGMERGDD